MSSYLCIVKQRLNTRIMEIKKSDKASLENKKLLFTEIGLVAALGIVYGAFNYSTNHRDGRRRGDGRHSAGDPSAAARGT